MFIPGHQEIIRASIAKHKLHIPEAIIKDLEDGITFPDMACKKLTPQLTFRDSKACYYIKLFKVLHGKQFGFSTIYQFHRGALLHLHSMSPQPNITLIEQRKLILDLLLALLVTIAYGGYGFQPKSAYVLGIILHTMTDSYPRGHTIRHDFYKPPIVPAVNIPAPSPGITKQARTTITNVIKNLAAEPAIIKNKTMLIQKIIQQLPSPPSKTITTYFLTSSSSIYHTYLIYKFLASTTTTATKYRKQFNISSALGISQTSPHTYDLKHFQVYDIQDSTFHKKQDLLMKVSDYPIYDRILSEVATLITIYQNFINNKISAKKFIKDAYRHIATQTFRIAAEDRNNPPALPKVAIR